MLNASIRRSAFYDPLNLYFLLYADNPAMNLVSQPFNGDNSIAWSHSMMIALSAKNKIGFINGSIKSPYDCDSDLLSAWIRSNSIVISWILNSVSKDISASIIFSESAADIWNDRHDRFQQSNGPRVFQLHRDLACLAQKQESVSIYFTKLKKIWEELEKYKPHCNCGNVPVMVLKKFTITFSESM